MRNFTILVFILLSFTACKSGFNSTVKYTGIGKSKLQLVNETTTQEIKSPLSASLDSEGEIIFDEIELTYSEIEIAECDEIIQRDGKIIEAKVTEVGLATIKYKLCSYLEGPTHIVSKSDVFMIRYSNGSTELFEVEEKVTPKKETKTESELEDEIDAFMYKKTGIDPNAHNDRFLKWNGQPKTEGFGIASLVVSIVGAVWYISFLGMFLGILGLIFGAISIGRINSSGNVLRGRGFAIAGLVIGVFVTVIYGLLFIGFL